MGDKRESNVHSPWWLFKFFVEYFVSFCFFKLLTVGLISMPIGVGILRRLLYTMATEGYKAGTHSMAFVTVPNEEVAKKLAGYAVNSCSFLVLSLFVKIYHVVGNQPGKCLLALQRSCPKQACCLCEHHSWSYISVGISCVTFAQNKRQTARKPPQNGARKRDNVGPNFPCFILLSPRCC